MELVKSLCGVGRFVQRQHLFSMSWPEISQTFGRGRWDWSWMSAGAGRTDQTLLQGPVGSVVKMVFEGQSRVRVE